MALIDRLGAEIKEKRPHMQKTKVLFHQDNAPCHKSMKTLVKFNELSFKLLPHPPYSPYLAKTEAYFEREDESFYKRSIENLEKRWNEVITLEGNYVDE